MEYDKEDLKELAAKVKRAAVIKGGYRDGEYRHTVVYDDGSLAAVFSVGACGYYEDEHFDVPFGDLDKSESVLEAERIEAEKKRKEWEEAEKLEREKREKADQAARDLREYERLKKLFR